MENNVKNQNNTTTELLPSETNLFDIKSEREDLEEDEA